MTVPALHIDTLGGAQRVRLRAATDPQAPVIGCFPALGIRAGYYDALLDALAERGLNALVADAPGHGDSPVRPSRETDWGYADLVEHAAAVRRAAADRFPGAPFVWMGHSIGAQIALLHAGRADADVAGLVLIAAGLPDKRAWTGYGRLRLQLLATLIHPLTALLGHYPGDRLRFGGREASRLMRDWTVIARTGGMRFNDLDGDALFEAVTQPILHIGIEGDDYVTPASIDAMLRPLASTDVIRETWPKGQTDHNRWPRQQAKRAAARIADWTRATL